MTATQDALTQGFRANLEHRGFFLTLEGSVPALVFHALVPPINPEDGEFQIGKNEREFSSVRILREDLANPYPIEIGSYLIDELNARRHRVADIIDHPTDVGVTFTCETVPLMMAIP